MNIGESIQSEIEGNLYNRPLVILGALASSDLVAVPPSGLVAAPPSGLVAAPPSGLAASKRGALRALSHTARDECLKSGYNNLLETNVSDKFITICSKRMSEISL